MRILLPQRRKGAKVTSDFFGIGLISKLRAFAPLRENLLSSNRLRGSSWTRNDRKENTHG
jgi:hypothetical protein